MAGQSVGTHPPYSDLVVSAVKCLQTRKGVSRQKILKYISSNYDVKQGYAVMVKQALKRCVSKNILVQVKGTGASGSFKINNEKNKVLSPRNSSDNQLIPLKPRPLPLSQIADKENSCGTVYGRGSRTASKNARERIKSISDAEVQLPSAQAGKNKELPKRKRSVLSQKEVDASSDFEGEESSQEEEEEEEEEKPVKKKGKSLKAKKEKEPKDEDEGLCEYEKQRLKKIKENRAFLASLNIGSAKEELKSTIKKPAPKKRVVDKPNPADLEPSRCSLRIRKIQPNGQPMAPPPPPEVKSMRLPDVTLSMASLCENHTSHTIPEDVFRKEIVDSYKTVSEAQREREQRTTWRPSHRLLSFQDVELTYSVKITSRRTTTFAFHPASNKSLVVAGDRLGMLSLWDISKGSPGVYHYEAHADSVTDLALSSCRALPSSHILSASKDGTLRFVDLERGVLDLVYSTPEVDCIGLTSCDISSTARVVLAGQSNGTMVQLDLRMRDQPVKHIQAHDRMIRSVHANQVYDNLLLSASSDCYVKLWDMRNLSYHLCSLPFPGCVTGAYFSPVCGSKLLVTTLSNTIRVYHEVFSQSGGLSGLLPGKRLYHKNYAGVNQLRAQWDPASDDCFIVGTCSQDDPRQDYFTFDARCEYGTESDIGDRLYSSSLRIANGGKAILCRCDVVLPNSTGHITMLRGVSLECILTAVRCPLHITI